MSVKIKFIISLILTVIISVIYAEDLNLGIKPDPTEGYRIITSQPLSAPIMKTEDVDLLWNVWEDEEKIKAESSSVKERRHLTFERYGWVRYPGEGDYNLPFDYTEDGQGNLVTNCFSCHGGKVAGVTMPGVGNTHLDLTTLATDIQKLNLFKKDRDYTKIKDVKAPFNTPLNYHKGFTNAVIFAPVFSALRDPEYGKMLALTPDLLKHHDMNPPAWWNYKKKTRIYADAFAPKTPRQLMPFAMSPTFSDEKFRSFEPYFVHISAYINSLEPPKYPFDINEKLAFEGQIYFEQTCTRCHGTYGDNEEFPNKVIPINEIGTDPVRFQAITKEMREKTNKDWLQYYGEYPVLLETVGYLAQPLDGIWASAPYFHNGSSPTLWHVLNPSERPEIWKRTENGYDKKRIGLEVEEFQIMPEKLSIRLTRMYYDTTHIGNSKSGHTFPDELDQEEKLAVLEYLKTL
jgi:cytochrome c553